MRGRTVLISDLVTVRLAVGGVAHIGGANDLVRAHLLGASWALLQLNRSLEGLTVLQGLDLGMASNERVGASLDKRPLTSPSQTWFPIFARRPSESVILKAPAVVMAAV